MQMMSGETVELMLTDMFGKPVHASAGILMAKTKFGVRKLFLG